MKISKIAVPSISVDISNKDNSIVQQLNDNIKNQLTNIKKILSQKHIENEDEIKSVLNEAESLITDCHTLKEFNILKSRSLNRLMYECQRLSVMYITYKTENKLENIKIYMKQIDEKQESISSETGNLVYNILGFIASFSIISAAVTAVGSIKGTINLMLFMVFLSLLLILTLIALNNFYKNRKFFRTRLQDNYFICKILIICFIILLICRGAQFVKENINVLGEAIGRGIEQVRQENIKEQE